MSSNTSYRLLDCGGFQKLEAVGAFVLARPSPQALWPRALAAKDWQRADAIFTRNPDGNGVWTLLRKGLPARWPIAWQGLKLQVRLTDFGHLGLFPEQAANLNFLKSLLSKASSSGEISVLNLFAYTGAASLLCAQSGCAVTHVDASKTSVAWARENAELSGLQEKPIRWIVDDTRKFVQREIKRGRRYRGIILDPPSFGRGEKGELWKIEEHLPALLQDLVGLLSDDFLFVLLSSHSPGHSPAALAQLMRRCFGGMSGVFKAEEMLIAKPDLVLEPFPIVSESVLPSGAACFFLSERSKA